MKLIDTEITDLIGGILDKLHNYKPNEDGKRWSLKEYQYFKLEELYNSFIFTELEKEVKFSLVDNGYRVSPNMQSTVELKDNKIVTAQSFVVDRELDDISNEEYSNEVLHMMKKSGCNNFALLGFEYSFNTELDIDIVKMRYGAW